MIHFYFKDKLINDFFYKDVFCLPCEIALRLNKKLELNFIWTDKKIINPYFKNENLKIVIHKNYFFMFLYFFKNIRTIKILWLFHLYRHTILFSYLYKIFNWNGKTLIKWDFNLLAINNLININKKHSNILENFLNKIDIIIFENNNLYKNFKDNINYKNKSFLIKNSLYIYDNIPPNNYLKKENIILTIGRIYYEDAKRYSFLLKSLLGIKEYLKDWKIIFIWEIIWEFWWKKFNFLLENKEIINKLVIAWLKIEFKWSIYSRNVIYNYLNKSKIFCISSCSEWDPLVQYEAMYYGNIMVSTDVWTIKENYYNKWLFISDINDINKYQENLIDAIKLTTEPKNDYLYNDIHKYCIDNYTRENNLNELTNELKWN